MFVVYFYYFLLVVGTFSQSLCCFALIFFKFSLQCLAINTHEYTVYIIKQPIKQDKAY